MNIIQQAEHQILRPRAIAAVASIIKSAEYYYNEGIKAADEAANSAEEAAADSLIDKATYNERKAKDMHREAEALNAYISSLELALGKAADHIAAAHQAGLETGLSRAGEPHNDGKVKNRIESERAKDWLAERVGGSTEGEWINGIHISQIKQQPKITKHNINQYQ